jgi:hypothetical protein
MLLKLAAKLPVVVNFPVEDDDIASVGVDHWLMARCRQVNNRKPAKQKACADAVRLVDVGPATFIVGAAMELRSVNPGE